MQNSPLKVLVSGDVPHRWNLASGDGLERMGESVPSEASFQAGGARLLGQLIEKTADLSKAQIQITYPADVAINEPERASFRGAYAVYAQFEDKEKGRIPPWRVKEQRGFGSGPHHPKEGSDVAQTQETATVDHHEEVIICENPTPLSLKYPKTAWRLLHFTRDDFWKEKEEWHFNKNMIVIVEIEYLRLMDGVQISRGLSWEKTTEDVVREMRHRQNYFHLSECAHFIVSIPRVGAICFSTGESSNITIRLYYNPHKTENHITHSRGSMLDYAPCFITGIALSMIHGKKSGRRCANINLDKGIFAGLAASCKLFSAGYHCTDSGINKRLSFPKDEGVALFSRWRSATMFYFHVGALVLA